MNLSLLSFLSQSFSRSPRVMHTGDNLSGALKPKVKCSSTAPVPHSSAGRTDCTKPILSSQVDLKGICNANLSLGKDPAPHRHLWLSHFLKVQEDIFPSRVLRPEALSSSCLKSISSPSVSPAFLMEVGVSGREEQRLWGQS